jgi:hypothetical protein
VIAKVLPVFEMGMELDDAAAFLGGPGGRWMGDKRKVCEEVLNFAEGPYWLDEVYESIEGSERRIKTLLWR